MVLAPASSGLGVILVVYGQSARALVYCELECRNTSKPVAAANASEF